MLNFEFFTELVPDLITGKKGFLSENTIKNNMEVVFHENHKDADSILAYQTPDEWSCLIGQSENWNVIHVSICSKEEPVAGYVYDVPQRTLYMGVMDGKTIFFPSRKICYDDSNIIIEEEPMLYRKDEMLEEIPGTITGLQIYNMAHLRRIMNSGILYPAGYYGGESNVPGFMGSENAPAVIAAKMFCGEPRGVTQLLLIHESECSIFETLALLPIIQAAGGSMTRLDGSRLFHRGWQGTQSAAYLVSADGTTPAALSPRWMALSGSSIRETFVQRFSTLSLTEDDSVRLSNFLNKKMLNFPLEAVYVNILKKILNRQENKTAKAMIARFLGQLNINDLFEIM